ncbi:MAG: cytochrome P450 [Polyangiaceae bacterium]
MADPSDTAPVEQKYDLLSPSFFADPHPVFHRMRSEDPVYFHPVLRHWVLTRYEDIQTLGRDARFSAQRSAQFAVGLPPEVMPKFAEIFGFLSHWLTLLDPPRHTVLRSLVSKAFTPQSIDALAPSVRQIVDEMLDGVVETGEMDLIRDLAFPLPALVIAKMLGVPREQLDVFKGHTDGLFLLIGAGIATVEAVDAAHRGVLGLQSMLSEIVEARRREPKDDLISRLLAVEDEGVALQAQELMSMCALLLVAGHETTTHQIGNAVIALLEHPAELAKLKADPSLMEGAVEELLRYDGPVMMLSRRATEAIEIGGKRIAEGDIVVGFIHAGNRDPAVFEDPDRLDVTRRGVRSLSFGHGIHYCIGAALARLEARIALGEALRRLPGLRLATESAERLPNLMIRGVAALPVRFDLSDGAPSSRSGRASWTGPASVRAPLSQRAPVSVPLPPLVPQS